MSRRTSLLLSASETQLFLCLPNLPREIARIRVSLGPDHEATKIAPRHYRLVAARNGTLLLQQGTLDEGQSTAESVHAVAASEGSGSWGIELAIDLTYLGGRARRSALRVALEKDNGATVAAWPRSSHASNPSSWTLLEVGSQPVLTAHSAGALSVDGQGSYLVIPYSPDLSPPEYTIEAWVRARNHSCGTVFGSVSPDAPWLGICDTVQFHARGGATHQGRRQLDQSWHHIAVTVDRDGNETLYVDGEQDSRVAFSRVRDTAGRPAQAKQEPFLVGAGFGAPQARRPFQGFIRGVRVWNYPRTQGQVRHDSTTELVETEAGLVGHWPLDRYLRDGAGSHDGGLVGKASLVVGVAAVDQTLVCFSANHRAPPELDRSRTNPLIDIGTCVDERPKIGFASYRDLPAKLRAGLGSFDDDDRFLLYVPAAGPDGRRSVTISGSTNCSPDPCPASVSQGRPTEEKCPVPKPDACAAKLEVSPTEDILLSSTTLNAQLSGGGTDVSLKGVIVAAYEIVLAGHVRTNGQNLALVASQLTVPGDANVDASALRQANGANKAGGRVALVADTVSVNGSLAFSSFGSPGALPRTTQNGIGIHPDCPDTSPAENDLPKCFPCMGGGLSPVANISTRKVDNKLRCITSTLFTGPTETFFYEYPKDPAQFPQSVLFKVPAGYPSGAAGAVSLQLSHTNKSISISKGTGMGSQGLQGYRVNTNDQFTCPAGYAGCVIDQFLGASYLVPDGKSFVGASGSVMYRNPTDPPDFGTVEMSRILADLSDELIGPEQAMAMLDQAYRSGNKSALGLGYLLMNWILGEPWEYPCSLVPRATAMKAEITARLAQLSAGLDWTGRAPDWAPSAPPDELSALVKSELQQSAQLVSDLKANALISITSANLQGNLVKELESADGEIATLEAARNDLLLKEKQAHFEEVQTYVARNQSELQHLQNNLVAYVQAKLNPPSSVSDALQTLGEKLLDFGGAYVSAAKSLDLSTGSGLVKAGKSLYDALDKLIEAMSTEDFACVEDTKCLGLMHDMEQARLDLHAARQALQAALYAVQAEQAEEALFDARRTLSKDIARIFQGNQFVVRDYDALARAGKYLCHYGRMVTDNAAADLHSLKRSAALWDVPRPLAEETSYDGAGGKYDFDFLQFLGSDCKALDCTLWGDFNQFLAARTTQGMPPNQQTIFLGFSGDEKSKALAALFHNLPVPGNRVEMSLSLIQVEGASGPSGTFFAAQPSLLAKGQGASATAPVLATPDFATRSAVQLHDLTVRAYTGGAPVRQNFPFRLTRPSGERYVNQLNPRKELAIEVAIPLGRELDGGGLLDRMEYDASVSGFRLEICCGGAGWTRPESLLKNWILWVPVCADAVLPSQECASKDELQGIENVELVAKVRFRVN